MKNLSITLTFKDAYDLQHDPKYYVVKRNLESLIDAVFKRVMLLIDTRFAKANIQYERNFNKFPKTIKFNFYDITFERDDWHEAVSELFKQIAEESVTAISRTLAQFIEVSAAIMANADAQQTSKFKFYQNRDIPVAVTHDRDFFGNLNETTYSLALSN